MAGGLLSVVIPTYNEGAYLGETLDALIPQLEPGDEVIVVDSFSRDATVEVAEAHGARLVQTPRDGIGAAKAVGIRAARSPIVAFLDADSVPASDWVARIRARFQEPKIQAVAGFGRYRSRSRARQWTYNAFARGVWWLGAVGYAAFQLPWLPVNNCAFRREAVMDHGGYRSVVCEDLEFAVRARGLPGVVYDSAIRVVLSDRRFRSGSFVRQVVAWAHADVRILVGRPLAASNYGAPR